MTDSELLQRVATDVAVIKDRVIDLKDWVATHPRICPLPEHIEATVDSPKERRVSGWAIFAAVIGAIGVIGALAIAILK